MKDDQVFAPTQARTVCELLDYQARTHPNATAMRTPERSWTYAELHDVTTRLAHRLRHGGVHRGSLTGLLVHRSPLALIGMLAIFRCGAACMPLNPDDPPARNQDIIADGGCGHVLVGTATEWLPDAQIIDEADFGGEAGDLTALAGPTPLDLAYTIATSGSTGRPKSVAVPHSALFNLVITSIDDLRLVAEQDVVLWICRPTVDVTMQDCLMALCCGACVAIPAYDDFLPGSILMAARALGATVVDIPAAVVGAYGQWLLPRLARLGVRLVITGGSRLDGAGVAGAIGDSLVVLNAYGPTETTVTATLHTCSNSAPRQVPIGRPIGGVRTYVLNESLLPVAAGSVGQLYIAGAGLAWGYLGLPARTAAVFLPDPFSTEPGQRMYATGDRVRLRLDGDLEFMGRLDDQVKISGFRVETGEVEHRLRECPGVHDAAVVVRDDAPGGAAVVAFLVGTRAHDGAIGDHLRRQLPSHMIPRIYVWLNSLPLNRIGKLDRAALATAPLPSSQLLRLQISPTP